MARTARRAARGMAVHALWLALAAAAVTAGAVLLLRDEDGRAWDDALLEASELRRALVAVAGAADLARETDDVTVLDRAALALGERIDALAPAAGRDAGVAEALDEARLASDALLAEAYDYATARSGTGSGADTFTGATEAQQRLVDAVAAAGERAAGEEAGRVLFGAALLAAGGVALLARAGAAGRAASAQVRRAASIDPLTGRPTRAALTEELARRFDAEPGREVAVAVAQVEPLASIARTAGHEPADALMLRFVRRLERALPDAAIARGRDYQVIVALDAARAPEAMERMLELVREPLSGEGRTVTAALAAGVAVFPSDASAAGDLLARADLAASLALSAGGDRIERYTSDMRARAERRVELGSQLRGALARREFTVEYQPIVDVDSGEVAAVEALLRWRHPEHGTIPPEEFIPLLEEGGLIEETGRWVLRTACHQLASWRGGVFPHLRLSVNLAPRQLRDEGLARLVATVLAETGLPGDSIELEVTESAAVGDGAGGEGVLRALADLGVRFALDDFGTGHSSLTRLREMPFSTVKIDRSFVSSIVESAFDRAIVENVVALARGLDLEVVAEGVETPEQRELLARLGCRLMQGYLFSPPAPPETALDIRGRAA